MGGPFLGRASLGALAAAALAALAPAACADVPDLLSVYQSAQAADPTIRSARFALDVAREKLPEARAALLPVAALTSDAGRTTANTAFSGSPAISRGQGTSNWTLQVSQPIFNAGAVFAHQEASSLVDSAESQYLQARQDLLLRVAQAYFGVNEAADAIAAADGQIAAMTAQLAQVRQGQVVGTHSTTDVDDIRTRLGSARAQRVAALNDLESARADLEKITSQHYERLAALRPGAGLSLPDSSDQRSWSDRARADNPAVRAQAAALEAAHIEISRARSDHLPTLELVASVGRNRSSHSLSTPDDYSTRVAQHAIALQLNIPLFAGGATVAKVNEAVGAMNKADADLEAARRGAAADAQHAYAAVANGLAQIEALDVAVDAGANAVKGNTAGYRLGIRTSIDVLNSQQQLYAAQRDLSKARYEVLLQGMKLKAAAGALDDDDVRIVNALLLQ